MFFKSKKRNIDLQELEESFQNLVKKAPNLSNYDDFYGPIKKQIILIDKKIKEIKKKENHFSKLISNFINDNEGAPYERTLSVYEEKMLSLKFFFESYFPQLDITIKEIDWVISYRCKAYHIISPAFNTLNDTFLILNTSIGKKFYYFEKGTTHEFDDFDDMMNYWINEHFPRFYLKIK